MSVKGIPINLLAIFLRYCQRVLHLFSAPVLEATEGSFYSMRLTFCDNTFAADAYFEDADTMSSNDSMYLRIMDIITSI